MALRKKAKSTVGAREALAELFNKLTVAGCDPIKELAELAMDATTPLHDRIAILKELAQYTAPKRRAIDLMDGSGNEDGLVVKIVKYSKDTKGQAEKMMKPAAVTAIRNGRDPNGTEAEEEKEAASGS